MTIRKDIIQKRGTPVKALANRKSSTQNKIIAISFFNLRSKTEVRIYKGKKKSVRPLPPKMSWPRPDLI
jgi:penicillin-binding protein-related factor A (putative recombinase)